MEEDDFEDAQPPDVRGVPVGVVAVVGRPNVGKSTLVGALSAASPKVAAYPFTTLEPTLGRVQPEGDTQVGFTICDIPGLIEGAHQGRGLGLGFLRHAERALAFLHLVDVGEGVLTEGRDPVNDYYLVRNEVLVYRPEMAARQEVVVLNKIDTLDPDSLEEVMASFRACGLAPLAISASVGLGLDALVMRLLEVVAAGREQAPPQAGFELFRTERRALSVQRQDGGAWRLQGAALERWVSMCDLGNPQAVAHLQGRMDRAGVEQLLADAGASEGDEVWIGSAMFEWWPSSHSVRPSPGRQGGQGGNGAGRGGQS
ncbi:MAG: hypothetical protein NVSMB32_18540 [Actinomycetota bacterium]